MPSLAHAGLSRSCPMQILCVVLTCSSLAARLEADPLPIGSHLCQSTAMYVSALAFLFLANPTQFFSPAPHSRLFCADAYPRRANPCLIKAMQFCAFAMKIVAFPMRFSALLCLSAPSPCISPRCHSSSWPLYAFAQRFHAKPLLSRRVLIHSVADLPQAEPDQISACGLRSK